VSIGGYFKLNYHKILMAIGGHYINGYWWIFYWWIVVVIILMVIIG
jgi:hypothetical protein